MISIRLTAYTLLLAVLSLGSCKKEANKKTSCTGDVYGYKGVHYDSLMAYPCTVGNISTATAVSTSIGTISNQVHFNEGAYNISDNCYYTFKERINSPTAVDTLYRISMAGAVTPMTAPSGSRFNCLVYNRFTGSLYCIRTNAGVSHIAELTPGATTFATADLATTIYTEAYDNATVDNTTGDIYYQTLNVGAGFSIEKYHPGAAAPSAIVTGMPLALWGMRFNVNDNMLYAVNDDDQFIKMSTSGTMSTLATFSFTINMKFFAATLDPCSNHYIFSIKDPSATTGQLYQLDMSGSIIQHDPTTAVYQGLDVKY